MSKLHDCKRGLTTATPRDYNRWWRRITELKAEVAKEQDAGMEMLSRIAELEEELEYVEARLKEATQY